MKRMVELESDDDDHLYDLAYAYEKIEDYDNSISLYLKYLELEPFSDSPGTTWLLFTTGGRNTIKPLKPTITRLQ